MHDGATCVVNQLDATTQAYDCPRVKGYKTFPLGHIPWTVPTDNFPPTYDIPPTVKAKIWKLALTYTPDPNRSTPINFVHVTANRFILQIGG